MKSFKSHNIYHCGDCGTLWGYTPTRKTAQFPVENGCCGAVGLIRTFSYIEKIFFRFRISENKIVYIWGKTAPQPHTPITACFFNTFRPHKQPHAIAKSPHIQSNSSISITVALWIPCGTGLPTNKPRSFGDIFVLWHCGTKSHIFYIEKNIFPFKVFENKIMYIYGENVPQCHTPETA